MLMNGNEISFLLTTDKFPIAKEKSDLGFIST